LEKQTNSFLNLRKFPLSGKMICLSLFQTIKQNSLYDNIILRQNKRGKRVPTVNNLLAVLVFPGWDVIQEKAT